MDAINAIAEKYNLPVIEDAAQSFGATYKGKKSCNLSTIGSTSFFPSKPLGCYGDGGALFTNDDELAEKLRWIRVHGQERKHHHPILVLMGVEQREEISLKRMISPRFPITPYLYTYSLCSTTSVIAREIFRLPKKLPTCV